MSQQDSSSDGSIAPSSTRSEGPPDWFVKGRDCHYLGHLEAIPVNFGGTLKRAFKACVYYNKTEWIVLNSNGYGPSHDICFKLPCPGNNWIASLVVGSKSRSELSKLIKANEPKGVKYGYRRHTTMTYGETVVESFIFEGLLEGEERERVPEGPEMIPTLQERLGFDACEI